MWAPDPSWVQCPWLGVIGGGDSEHFFARMLSDDRGLHVETMRHILAAVYCGRAAANSE